MKSRGPKSGPDFGPFFGPCSIGTLSTGSKNGPIFGPAFWEAEYRHDLHFGARFWNRENLEADQTSSARCSQITYMWHPVILVQLQPKRAGWFQLAACTHWFLHLAATVEALCATAHFLRVFSGSLMNPPNRQKLWDVFNRSCILLPRLLPKSCRHNERFLSAQVRLPISGILGGALSAKAGRAPGHGMAEFDAAGCPSKPVACLKRIPAHVY